MLYNPNRFVSGLSDEFYIKQVNFIEPQQFPGIVPISSGSPNPFPVIQPIRVREIFVKDTFCPENLPDTAPDDEIG